ncbi:quinoprotein relay system zinc metallohydrolase 1 [Thiopseudomonas denitrificans]|uniref:Quinoprotein relay system zinc metallohydrolase 1 n=1 Tax=Thiopseudomonas denitrificans TaxID=1501432 RepID=A0A4V3D4H7_9GAMM|nr:quinoprotein relay system zinc metallohydrolase 1 [Thiopseudomonas denitrificans]TDQ36147.1 quinoprotein relay system zinc metallohydrolase 1 [Thiopseudomonas denitrificans]
MLRLVCGAILLGYCLMAQAAYDLQPKLVADNTWVLEGSTGNFSKENGGNIVNIAFIVTDTQVILIDSGPSFAYGRELAEAIRQITDKPVGTILLTHHHPDHMLGSQAFPHARVAALASTAQLMQEEGDAMAENMYRMVGDRMRGTEVVMPDSILEPGLLELDDYRLQLLQLHGHTNADLAIFDPQTGVLFAGDLVFYQRAVSTAHTPGIAVWLQDLDTLAALPWTVIVPGHGPVAGNDAPFQQMRDYLGWLDQLLTTAAARGDDMNRVMRSPVPERFAGISLAGYELIRTVSHLYPAYEQAYWQSLSE